MSSTGERVVAGRYRLRRRLGQGAMGTVWEAFDEFLRRPVAVKEVLLPPGLPDDHAAELRERTLREARAIASLSHSNVVTLHDVAREDGEPFVVMEYLLAHSLATVLHVLGPLPQAKAAAIADAVAAGLAAAHQVGITHRDVKPGNVLICVDGRVKLTDFGIARNVAERTLTNTGIMLGSPAYIAPEVAAGREVTPAADVWGLGATLFAMIEGRPPYDVDGAVLATVNQVVNGEVPRTSVEGPLSELVAALMVKETAERISLRELRNRLHPLLPPPSTPLLSEEDLARLDEVVGEQVVTSTGPEDAVESAPSTPSTPSTNGGPSVSGRPLAADPGPFPPRTGTGRPPAAAPGSLPLAASPGALPPGLASALNTESRAPARVGRGPVATAFVVVFAVLLFVAAAGGGFALSRHIGGEPILPPEQVPTSVANVPSEGEPEELVTRTGNAATITGAQGGGFTLPVPSDWVVFVEEISDPALGNSTRVYYVSPNGTQLLTVERLAGFYPDHELAEYLEKLVTGEPEVTVETVDETAIKGIETGPVQAPDSALEITYRTIANAKALVPDDPDALDQNRVTFARLLPYAGDLWVVAVTVPIDQEDSGSGLFERIGPNFQVTG